MSESLEDRFDPGDVADLEDRFSEIEREHNSQNGQEAERKAIFDWETDLTDINWF